jgi:hypothetical protein
MLKKRSPSSLRIHVPKVIAKWLNARYRNPCFNALSLQGQTGKTLHHLWAMGCHHRGIYNGSRKDVGSFLKVLGTFKAGPLLGRGFRFFHVGDHHAKTALAYTNNSCTVCGLSKHRPQEPRLECLEIGAEAEHGSRGGDHARDSVTSFCSSIGNSTSLRFFDGSSRERHEDR